ncbi:leucine-rich repeat protein [Carboxylicivirga sp. RSCT41]|uniref:leucine-rich repeat protein n=1 Tax=Carboxylicivirga agarovorans TaxID=3417570 RepID=UPI003D33E2A3
MKKFITIFTIAFLCVVTTTAQHTLTLSDISFNESTGLISSYTGTETNIVIPASFNVNGTDYPVLKINQNTFSSKDIEEVTIGKNVETIGFNAFNNCTQLATVTFDAESKLKAIEYHAFDGCALTSIALPESIESIGSSVFANNDLQTIAYGSNLTTLQPNSFDGNDNIQTINGEAYSGLFISGETLLLYLGDETTIDFIPSGVTTIRQDAFKSSAITSVDIPASVTTIEASAFRACALTEVTIPNSVTYIGQGAFRNNVDAAGNKSLKSLSLGNQVEFIGDGAFHDSELGELTIPASVTTIDRAAFADAGITKLTFGADSNLETIGAFVFTDNSFTTVEIPGSVKRIENDAFNGLSSLTTLTFEANSVIETIGDEAFRACALTGVTVPNSVTHIGEGAFRNNADAGGDKSLTSLSLGNQVEFIGEAAFHDSELGELTIPASVTTIETSAFNDAGITELTFAAESKLENIGSSAFYKNSFTAVEIPKSVKTIESSAFVSNSSLETLTFEPGSALETIDNYAFKSCGLTSVTIPNSVVSIGYESFMLNANLVTLDLSGASSLQEIGGYAFRACDIESLTIPNSVETIGDRSFSYNENLSSLTFAPTSSVNSIEGAAFYGCKLSTVELPNSVRSIGAQAFSGQNATLSPIDLPTEVTGYTVTWQDTDGNAATQIESATSGKSFEALYTINTYKVRFLNEEGNLIGEEQTVEHGSAASVPTVSKTGYTFLGWFDTTDDLEVTDFTNITEAIEVEARFSTATNLDTKHGLGIKLYPNPATSHFTIEGAEQQTLTIYSVNGALVKQIEDLSSTHTIQINDLPKGIYIVKAGGFTQRLLVK